MTIPEIFSKQVQKACFMIEVPKTQLTNIQSTKSEAAVTVRKKSVSCFTPTCVNTVNACL